MRESGDWQTSSGEAQKRSCGVLRSVVEDLVLLLGPEVDSSERSHGNHSRLSDVGNGRHFGEVWFVFV